MDYSSNVNYTAPASDASAAGLVMLPMMFVYIAVVVLMVVSLWKLFVKAGKPGWGSIVPFYNTYLMVEIAKKPVWWFAVILLVPLVQFVFMIMLTIDFVKAYGKGTGFGVLSLFFPFITFPIMAFDNKVQYMGHDSAAPVATPVAPMASSAAPESSVTQQPTFAPTGTPPSVNPPQQSQPVQPQQPPFGQ